jgi:glycosyltransferase involved in cell wall biosynthesis
MRYLLVGGSNCVVRGGYGEALMASVPGPWVNRSLGNSPSLRGVDYLVSNPHEVRAADRIVFEYALNDAIFENAHTLDAPSHALTLRALLAVPEIAARLVFVLLVGDGPSSRAMAGHSFVFDHYRQLGAAHGVPVIDLVPFIAAARQEVGAAVFKDGDHFADPMVARLVEATITALANLPGAAPPAPAARVPRLVRVSPLAAAGAARGVQSREFRSSLLASHLAQFEEGGTIEVISPGGLFMGCYAQCSRDAGMLRVTLGERELVKPMRHRFGYDKPFVALRHLTTPLPTHAGERLILGRVSSLADAPGAQLDPTFAQVANGNGGELLIGDLLFLQPDGATTPGEQPVPMHSTLRHLHSEAESFDPSRTVGRFLRAPDASGKRKAEGGLRLQGRHKRSQPGLPLVSIVTVCLNSAATISQTFASVLGQDYENIEYIVVDGGSEDGTLDLIRAHEHAIDYFVSEPDGGLYVAMNKALGLAAGAYVLILNADDWYETDCVSALVRGQQLSGADISSALARRVDGQGRPLDVIPPMPFDDSTRFGMSLRHELMLVPAAVYNRVGPYDPRYRIIADFEFSIRLYDGGCTVHEIQRPLLNFRVTGVSNSNWTRLVQEHRALIQQQFPSLDAMTLDALADARTYTAEKLDQVLSANAGLRSFCEALEAYGWRRALYGPQRPAPARAASQPRVSVIVPCFNAERTIERCLASICRQSLSDVEVICVDDGSTDSTPALLERATAKDKRIKSVLQQVNRGVAPSRNTGLRQARGEFVMFVDADDELLPQALQRLVDAAAGRHCDLVKGPYEKVSGGSTHVAGVPPQALPAELSLRTCGALLRNTEGFWSYLYRATFIRHFRFPEHLRVGEDSTFLINALVRARRVAWISEPVYRYHLHAASAMQNFDAKKTEDAIDWRERAFRILSDYGFADLARFYACEYWNPAYFSGVGKHLDADRAQALRARIRALLLQAGYRRGDGQGAAGQALDSLFDEAVRAQTAQASGPVVAACRPQVVIPIASGARREALIKRVRVGVFSTLDKGGAAIGSVRRVQLLRRQGVDATLHTLVATRQEPFIRPLIPQASQAAAWKRLKQVAMDPVMQMPGFRGRELFSMPASVIDATKYAKLLDSLDVVHLHWVVGILDHENFGAMTRHKAVVWTLADMAAFTGGCHYAEGCEEFTRECRSCHLLPPGSTIAHENWKVKREAYSKIENLQIICPSQWIADRVARSSLLGDRKIHVLPNAQPVDDFQPLNKVAARIRLGLPQGKRLILFGADSLANRRKGGDLLEASLALLAEKGTSKDVEVMVYGHHKVQLPLPTHSLGFLEGPQKLSLAYSAADVYAFPSREDNAPLTVAESLLCGTPVVSFPVGNVPELVTHQSNGYIAQYCDVGDFCAGLQWALQLPTGLPQRLETTRLCRESPRRHHDPLVAVDRHLSVYEAGIAACPPKAAASATKSASKAEAESSARA